jgi:hypothetical protein
VGVAAGVSQFVHQTGRGVHDLHALANQNLNKMAAGVLKLGDRQACRQACWDKFYDDF